MLILEALQLIFHSILQHSIRFLEVFTGPRINHVIHWPWPDGLASGSGSAYIGGHFLLHSSMRHSSAVEVIAMMASRAVILGSVLMGTPALAEDFQLPKEVTPALRAACETDVRRLCVGENPTVAKVKSCVYAKYYKLGRRCQVAIVAAGLSR